MLDLLSSRSFFTGNLGTVCTGSRLLLYGPITESSERLYNLCAMKSSAPRLCILSMTRHRHKRAHGSTTSMTSPPSPQELLIMAEAGRENGGGVSTSALG
ncbi:sphingomyelin phosphodiesterase 3 [Striga asiatica]|uniref:Sphingomyelin phosphodiesterase 3 n=1 Tax=Striga asiatica TaxID=4170 RepID=A0A5A7QA09_STRAF|nr:sphingomyelin phosphodiesterase 3 [Striga asiatica]